MSVHWIEHKEKKLIFINASNLLDDHVSLIANLETLISLLQSEPKKSVLALADLRNTHLNNTVLVALMRHALRAAPYFRKSALVIEANQTREFLLDSFAYIIQYPPKRFGDLDAAKAWLVNE